MTPATLIRAAGVASSIAATAAIAAGQTPEAIGGATGAAVLLVMSEVVVHCRRQPSTVPSDASVLVGAVAT